MNMPHQNRAGLNLLEVLISTFIVVVGILSLAALIPVGISDVAAAKRSDMAAALGRSAWREIKIRGLFEPILRQQNPNQAPFYTWFLTGDGQDDEVTSSLTPRLTPPPGVGVPLPLSAFVVDPWAISGLPTQQMGVFPANNDGQSVLRLPRYTVPRFRNAPINEEPEPLPYAVAQRMFSSSDQPSFTDDIDQELDRRKRVFILDNGQPVQPTDDQEYSWFITASPKLSYFTDIPREWYVSVVVVYRRPDPINFIDDRFYPVSQEKAAIIPNRSSFFDDGLGGGTVIVRWQSNNTDPDEDIYKVKSNDWVMLYGTYQHPQIGATLVARWYRVLSVGDLDLTNGNSREMTLLGADWDVENITDTHVAVVNRVVGVYEKTIKID